jgi:hypothetical protein
MAELAGSLDGFGLGPILRLLADVGQSGRLRFSQASEDGAGWSSELLLENGHVVAAFFGAAHGLGAAPSRMLSGLAALDAIVLVLPNAAFFFVAGMPPPERNVALAAHDLQARLATLEEKLLTSGAAGLSLTAVPRSIDLTEQPEDVGEEIVIDRGKLHLLMAIDGHRTIAELLDERDLLRTFRDLNWLASHALILLVEPSERQSPTAQAPLVAPPQTGT